MGSPSESPHPILRRFVPAVPVLSRAAWLMLPLDALDRVLSWPYRDFRDLPPNRMRIRVGVGNRLLFNAAMFRRLPVNFWIETFGRGRVTQTSNIVDLGCGCGRYAMTLRDFWFHGRRFAGQYLGVDVDAEMLDWCRANFPADRFSFHHVEVLSKTYNPGGHTGADSTPAPFRVPVDDSTQDLVFANSLFSHLLEDDFRGYVREAARVLRIGGWFMFSAFCLEDVSLSPNSRWSFRHRAGAARVEDERYPEAAVAYERGWIERVCRDAGFANVELMGSEVQTMIVCRR
jgi:SAM-dependent methyltransferase